MVFCNSLSQADAKYTAFGDKKTVKTVKKL